MKERSKSCYITHLFSPEENIESKKAWDRNYRRLNRDKERDRRLAHKAKRRAEKHRTYSILDEVDKSIIQNLYSISRSLSRINKAEYHVDHIKPLAKGGEHHWYNLQIITASANLAKGCR